MWGVKLDRDTSKPVLLAVAAAVALPVASANAAAASAPGSRLARSGYSVRSDVNTGGLIPAPRSAFSVRDVDWTSAHAFSVAVYLFSREPSATHFAKALEAKLGPFARRFPKSFARQHRVRVVSAHVYVAFTEMDQTVCFLLGVCTDYSAYNIPRCSTGASGLTCAPPVAVPARDFDVLVARAEGR